MGNGGGGGRGGGCGSGGACTLIWNKYLRNLIREGFMRSMQ